MNRSMWTNMYTLRDKLDAWVAFAGLHVKFVRVCVQHQKRHGISPLLIKIWVCLSGMRSCILHPMSRKFSWHFYEIRCTDMLRTKGEFYRKCFISNRYCDRSLYKFICWKSDCMKNRLPCLRCVSKS